MRRFCKRDKTEARKGVTIGALNKLRMALFALSITLLQFTDGGCGPRSNNNTASAPAIREITASGHEFGATDVFLSQSTLRLFWKEPDGTRIGTYDKLNTLVSDAGNRLVFATNAGIFDANFSPCGLYVQDGRELVPLNLNSGNGNFYMKPNGIFLIDIHGAAIIKSSDYQSFPTKPLLATQSGPLLLTNGQINPAFSPDSNNRRVRSGVGVISPDHIAFVISRDRVTFYELAAFFHSTLNCANALYLDGEISRFYPDPTHTPEHQDDFAGMFAVTKHN
jgi:uncharacterized protein YigE (DUF2233 family)